ncbi:ESX secretion-associated protein EspG [Nocardia miyunensis]|uniref:ESX secretion-associated protein EspG n=1 Tax=Nocardia miyunensis TaxID=282684 RepID=UPI0008334CEF|nr:ESX secretion-associated protein EspG [Nocardia miyunensis]
MTTLTTDGALAVAAALDIQTLPTALAVRPRHADHEQLVAARHTAVSDLRERGVLDRVGDLLDDDLATALFALARPESELSARIIRGDKAGGASVVRFCLVRRGREHAVAVRTGDELEVRTVWADDDPSALTRPLLTVLGPCPPADFPAFSAPTDELAQRLDTADGTDTGYAQAAYRLGIPDAAAVAFGAALCQRRSTAEIVCYSHRDGLAVRSPAAAAVYDTAAGRIIGGGSITADGRTWTTLAPGSDHRAAQVIATLIESLPEGRWMP